MIAQQRHDMIIEAVEARGTVTVPELAEELGISESTVRRDLEKLDSARRLVKVHGGATTLEEEHVLRDLTIPERSGLHDDEKSRIAAYAASLIKPTDFVYIDAGTTTGALVDQIRETRAHYVTNSVSNAIKLAAKGCQPVILGGEFKNATESLVGPEALDALNRFHFTLGFWGTNAVDEAAGLTTPDRSEALIKRTSMMHTDPARRFVITDASKFGRVAPVSFGEIDSATILTAKVPEAFQRFDNIVAIPEA